MKVTLGGDRLGSGNKNKIALRNYERSTHNLSQRWTSSMAPGVLYPFLVIPAMRGDKFEIDLEAAARTIPTRGPLFGSYKMQVDIFQCPMRLYQAVLHNNPTAIGLKMSQVKLPLLTIYGKCKGTLDPISGTKFNNSCLMKYLGISGLGTSTNLAAASNIGRKFNAIPALAYYDIFKTYYSNKQEQNAYVIGNETIQEYSKITYWYYYKDGNINLKQGEIAQINYIDTPTVLGRIFFDKQLNTNTENIEQHIDFQFYDLDESITNYSSATLEDLLTDYPDNVEYSINNDINDPKIFYRINNILDVARNYLGEQVTNIGLTITSNQLKSNKTKNEFKLKPFHLKNIDDMRMALLSHNNLGTAFEIINSSDTASGKWTKADGDDNTGLPYTQLVDRTGVNHDEDTQNLFPLNGLVVKTYQSDLFNNWINTEWIDGENGIAAITAISTSGDSFKIDALNLAEKLYNMLNRIAVSGGTYEDWQDAVYTESPRRHIESPMYLGGMSSEVVFEEIVQSAPATTDGGTTELGTLGGRGVLVKRKGGNVTVKVDEASFIIGIVSLTPRIMYTQGNEFYMTDLLTLDDLHKPALDGIGFQNLIAERAAWFDTKIQPNTATPYSRNTMGKVPAWIEYMTAVDKAYGDLAEEDGKGFMILNRNYEASSAQRIKDATTYIDPQKYNYAFAYTELDAQNFWVQIQSNIRARRLMSAKQIPNI